MLRKLMDWFLYDNGLRHERVKESELCVLLEHSSQNLCDMEICLTLLSLPDPGGRKELT